MPWVETYTDRAGRKRYRGAYRDAAGRKRRRTFTTRAAAARWAGEEESKVHRGQRSDPASARMLWGVWADTWWPSKAIEPGTRQPDEARLRNHVRPRWDKTPLIAITRRDVQAWVVELDAKMAASTVRSCYHLLSSSLRAAVADGILAASPCVEITLPTLPTGQERYLTEAESAKLFYYLDGRYRVLAELLLGTGLRLSEACGLHAARVDLSALRLDVIEVYDGASGSMRGYPKGKRRRSVPLSPALAGLLQEWLDRHPPKPTCGKRHKGGHCPGGLLITGPQGSPIDRGNFEQRQWRTAAMHAGFAVPLGKDERGRERHRLTVTPHDLRHSYASRLLQRGVSIERVQILLGHESVTTTSRYAHLVRDDWAQVRDALEGAAEGANPSPTGPHSTGRPSGLRAI